MIKAIKRFHSMDYNKDYVTGACDCEIATGVCLVVSGLWWIVMGVACNYINEH